MDSSLHGLAAVYRRRAFRNGLVSSSKTRHGRRIVGGTAALCQSETGASCPRPRKCSKVLLPLPVCSSARLPVSPLSCSLCLSPIHSLCLSVSLFVSLCLSLSLFVSLCLSLPLFASLRLSSSLSPSLSPSLPPYRPFSRPSLRLSMLSLVPSLLSPHFCPQTPAPPASCEASAQPLSCNPGRGFIAGLDFRAPNHFEPSTPRDPLWDPYDADDILAPPSRHSVAAHSGRSIGTTTILYHRLQSR